MIAGMDVEMRIGSEAPSRGELALMKADTPVY